MPLGSSLNFGTVYPMSTLAIPGRTVRTLALAGVSDPNGWGSGVPAPWISGNLAGTPQPYLLNQGAPSIVSPQPGGGSWGAIELLFGTHGVVTNPQGLSLGGGSWSPGVPYVNSFINPVGAGSLIVVLSQTNQGFGGDPIVDVTDSQLNVYTKINLPLPNLAGVVVYHVTIAAGGPLTITATVQNFTANASNAGICNEFTNVDPFGGTFSLGTTQGGIILL